MNDEWDEHDEPRERYKNDPRAANDAFNYGVSLGVFIGGVVVGFLVWLWSKAP